jgi:hypothetical protein
MEKPFFEIHRSVAINMLLNDDKNPTRHTNLKLAELLEEKFPRYERSYLVKEDDLPLQGNKINNVLEF